MAAKIRVHVVKAGSDFFVQPAIVTAEQGDSLRLVNVTDEDMVFYISDPTPLKFATDQTKFVKAGKKDKIELATAATDNLRFEFQIMMVKSGVKAKGNSDPVLIIDN